MLGNHTSSELLIEAKSKVQVLVSKWRVLGSSTCSSHLMSWSEHHWHGVKHIHAHWQMWLPISWFTFTVLFFRRYSWSKTCTRVPELLTLQQQCNMLSIEAQQMVMWWSTVNYLLLTTLMTETVCQSNNEPIAKSSQAIRDAQFRADWWSSTCSARTMSINHLNNVNNQSINQLSNKLWYNKHKLWRRIAMAQHRLLI
jgi:hypothetical protein